MYREVDYGAIGKLLEAERKRRKLTRPMLAEFMTKPNEAGVTFHMVKNWEDGRSRIDLHYLVKVCNVYGLPVSHFLRER